MPEHTSQECCASEDSCKGLKLTRRTFFGGLSVAGLATLVPGCGSETTRAADKPAAAPEKPSVASEDLVELSLTVNKNAHTLKLDPRVTLLDLLRENLNLPGTKKGCDHGQCGACTVLVNGRTTNACLTLAVLHPNAEIATIEGVANGLELHPVQAAFLKHDAFQCGYCTPGQIMSAVSLVSKGQKSSADEIREYMSGNICRCGAYTNILAAVLEAQDGEKVKKEKTA